MPPGGGHADALDGAAALAAGSSEAAAGTPDADLAAGIGRRLAAHRAARGMRVAELAREVGVTPSLISQIEHGQSRPSVSTLFALAQALAVPVDAFFRESPPAPEPDAGSEPGANRGDGRYGGLR